MNLAEFKKIAPRGTTHLVLVSCKDKKTRCLYDRIVVDNDNHKLYAWDGKTWAFCGLIDKTSIKRRIKI